MLEGGILPESVLVRTVQSCSLQYLMTSLEITIMNMPLKGLNIISYLTHYKPKKMKGYQKLKLKKATDMNQWVIGLSFLVRV